MIGRRRSRASTWVVIVVLALVTVPALLVARARGRESSQTHQTGERAKLTGTVRDQTGAPVRLAIVTLRSGTMASARSRISDDDGRFAFENLPAGHFTLSASKAAHITNEWGSTRPARPGTALTLAEGEERLELELVLPKGGVITGVVRDLLGRAVPNAEVAVLSTRPPLVATSETTFIEGVLTDDRGAYRIFGLEPGEYYVIAAMDLVGSGPVGMLTTGEIERELATARGDAGATSVVPVRSGVPVITYYPGTGQRENAIAVPVGLGEVRHGVDVALTLESASVVSGSVSVPAGIAPASVTVSMTPVAPSPMMIASLSNLTASAFRLGVDGSFRIPGVAPGQYRLVARWTPVGPSGSGGRMLWALTDLTVAGHDVAGILLSLQPGFHVSGRVTFEGATGLPETLSGFRLAVRSELTAESDFGWVDNPGAFATIRDDGTIEFPDLMPDRYDVVVSVPTDGDWWARSAVVNGHDALDDGLDVQAPIDDLVVTFTRENTGLSGTLTATSGGPAPGYVIVLFPADSGMWRPEARRIRTTRPADDGSYEFERLPAGEYRLAALTDIEEGEWRDPAFLLTLLPASVPVTVVDHGVTTYDIRIAGQR